MLFVKAKEGGSVMGALYKGVIVSGIIAAAAFYPANSVVYEYGSIELWYASLIGLALTAFMVVVTEYYTSTEYSPVEENCRGIRLQDMQLILLPVLGVSMKATALPVIAVCLSIWGAYMFGEQSQAGHGLYGIAIAATSNAFFDWHDCGFGCIWSYYR